LRKYLPDRAENNLPALYKDKSGESDVSERDIFYKVLIDLKKDVSELRKVVFGMLDGPESSEEYGDSSKPSIARIIPNDIPKDQSSFVTAETADKQEVYQHIVIEDRNAVGEHEVLSLEVKEEELIRKALLKNNGRRKKAAQELGISERTLYRKIKQYEIEN